MEILLIRGYVRKPCVHSFSNVNRTIDEQQPIIRRECSLPIGSRGKINLRWYEKWRYFAVLSDLVFCFSIILKQEWHMHKDALRHLVIADISRWLIIMKTKPSILLNIQWWPKTETFRQSFLFDFPLCKMRLVRKRKFLLCKSWEKPSFQLEMKRLQMSQMKTIARKSGCGKVWTILGILSRVSRRKVLSFSICKKTWIHLPFTSSSGDLAGQSILRIWTIIIQ